MEYKQLNAPSIAHIQGKTCDEIRMELNVFVKDLAVVICNGEDLVDQFGAPANSEMRDNHFDYLMFMIHNLREEQIRREKRRRGHFFYLAPTSRRKRDDRATSKRSQ